MNSNGTELQQIVHTHSTHVHRTSCRGGWPRGVGFFNRNPDTPEYLLPSKWVSVVFQSYSLPLRSEHVFTLHHSAAQNQTGTRLVCEQKAYLV